MTERDMMYGGYYQNFPGNMAYANYGYQMPPGAMLNNGMLPQMNMNQNTVSIFLEKIKLAVQNDYFLMKLLHNENELKKLS